MHHITAAFAQCRFTVSSFPTTRGLSLGEEPQDHGFEDQMLTAAFVQGSADEFALDREKVTIFGHGTDGWPACCRTCSAHSIGLLIGIVSQPDFCDDI